MRQRINNNKNIEKVMTEMNFQVFSFVLCSKSKKKMKSISNCTSHVTLVIQWYNYFFINVPCVVIAKAKI